MPTWADPRSCPEFTDFATPQKDESPEVAEASKINVKSCGTSPFVAHTLY